jgi:hypothetical protein
MEKTLLFLVAVIGLLFTTQAQDIILKKDGSEIRAKVIEITDQQVKYKEFDFQDGPTRNINNVEVFMITYENGQKEVFNKITETPPPPALSQQQPQQQRERATNCAKKLAFGLDVGLGGSFASANTGARSITLFAPALGFRLMTHINPYFGIDCFKFNWITDVNTTAKDKNGNVPYAIRLQLMPGVRGNTPSFGKCMSGYAAFRLGWGMDVGDEHFEGFCIETEVGMNFSRTVFAGFAYNYHRYFGYNYGFAVHTLSFRVGFNFGK